MTCGFNNVGNVRWSPEIAVVLAVAVTFGLLSNNFGCTTACAVVGVVEDEEDTEDGEDERSGGVAFLL